MRTEELEVLVNKVLDVLPKGEPLSPLKAAFVLFHAQEHLVKVFGITFTGTQFIADEKKGPRVAE